MQTHFTPEQLDDPKIAEADGILRNCVHCGFCTATCPTYVLLGDELDSPRGRIVLIKDMLENDRPADEHVVRHVDRCLSCLSCMSTCPASVDYMHLVDHARGHIEKTYRRPYGQRLARWLLAAILPHADRFAFAYMVGRVARPFAPLFRAVPFIGRDLAGLLRVLPRRRTWAQESEKSGVHAAGGARARRVAMLRGCVQPALKPEINDATIRILNRMGIDVVAPETAGCCGALVHHMGREGEALKAARANVEAYTQAIRERDVEAVVINASGCGTMVKDYGHILAHDKDIALRAARVSGMTVDISEFLSANGDLLDGAVCPVPGAVVAYHSACSMQHGQGIRTEPVALLEAAGFTVRNIPEGHLCCGSAGTYNILQPEIARSLRDRKIRNIETVAPDLVATGNIGCITQIGAGTDTPVVHTVELLDWAMGGPVPPGLAGWYAKWLAKNGKRTGAGDGAGKKGKQPA